jgi:hypothetical protein
MSNVGVMMAQAVYDMLFTAYTKTLPGVQQGSEEGQKFVILDWNGPVIDTAALNNAWSLSNPTGTQEAARYFSDLVDPIPSVSSIYEPNGNKVSQLYEQVVNSQVIPPPPNPEAEQRYKAAYDFLHTQVPNLDDDGNPVKPGNPQNLPVTIPDDSQIVKIYRKKVQAYNNAVTALMAAYSQYDMSKPQDQRSWSLLAPTLQQPVKDAWDDLQAARASKIESAVATLAQEADNQAALVLNNAKRNFYGWRRGNPEEPNSIFLPSFANPGNWYSSQSDGWTQITFSSEKLVLDRNSSFQNYGGSAGFSFGFFSIGGGGGHSEQQAHLDEQTSRILVSFEYKRVDIRRPWLDFQVFNMKGWRTNAYGPGGYSNGTFTSNHGAFPLLPTAFIVARNVRITANWGKTDMDYAKSVTRAGGGLSFGPFQLSGSYSSSSESKKFSSQFENGAIFRPQMQILGWLTRVVPYSPKSA